MSMYRKTLMAGIAAMALVSGYAGTQLNSNSSAFADDASKAPVPKALSFKMKGLDDDQTVDLSQYAGKVVLFVNVATKCGMTPQYEALEKIYESYNEKGFVIIGVPCNQFGGQEPGTNKEIRAFCTSKYDVKFPMLDKVNVNDKGSDKACDLYKYLTEQDSKPVGKGPVKWNFEKILLDKKGNVVARFAHTTKPDSSEVVSAIESALKE
jgi:glutathione peroxidase